MNDIHWVLLDTETNGLRAPIYVVELAAQRMVGWEPDGEPFRRLLNQNVSIPQEASRVNGYTREILERDGDPALDVYADFRRYAGTLPLVSYNLAYDLDRVLLPEWQRLDIAPIGQRGFCALELARRLLDPASAGNCKLQTLRQFYYLPERGAHTALGDVQTVIDLLSNVLQPLAQKRNLLTFEAIRKFTESRWYPRRITFGKYKGRDFHEALKDPNLRDWLTWLSHAEESRGSAMAKWYLSELRRLEEAAGYLHGKSEPDLPVIGHRPVSIIGEPRKPPSTGFRDSVLSIQWGAEVVPQKVVRGAYWLFLSAILVLGLLMLIHSSGFLTGLRTPEPSKQTPLTSGGQASTPKQTLSSEPSQTRKRELAAYLLQWQSHILRASKSRIDQGNTLTGKLLVAVTIRPNGDVSQIQVIKGNPDGSLALLVRSIVLSAAPFPALPSAWQSPPHDLRIVRTWSFQ